MPVAASPTLHGMGRVAAIVITYHPGLKRFSKLLESLPDDVIVVVVDNGSSSADVEAMASLLAARGDSQLIRNECNVGLAAAINQGAADPGSNRAEFLLLLDQDSIPRQDSLTALCDGILKLEKEGEVVGCVGPRLVDSATGLEHGFHTIRGLRWVRVFVGPGASRPVRCANLNGSGTLMRASVFKRMDGLDERLFVDHVDTDWSFRVLDAGLGLFGIPNAVFDHSMGERGMRFWFMGWRVWPVRSPKRHYFLFRNAITLMRRPYVPSVWKFWAMVKLGATFALHALFDARRGAQVGQMLKGLKDGLRRDE